MDKGHKQPTHSADENPSVRPKTKISPEKSVRMIGQSPSTPPKHAGASKGTDQIHAESQDERHRPTTRNADETSPTAEKKITARIPPYTKSLSLRHNVPEVLMKVEEDQQDKMTTSSKERHPKPSTSADWIRPDASCKVTESQTTMAHLPVNALSEEPRLRQLLTGDKDGEIDESFYPVLVANKPPEQLLSESEPDTIDQQFGFIKSIKWVTVLDFYSKSLVNGLCKLYHDDRMVTLQRPDLFRDIESDVELRNSIEFPEKTLWVFTNGREDHPSIETPHMDLQEWNKERSRDVEASVTFFSKPSVIPKGRAVIMFLVLSDDDIDILCDTFRKMSSSFQGLQNITCIVENQETYLKFVKGVEKWFSKDEIDERSVVGLKWNEINRIVMRMKGINQTGVNELPFNQPNRLCFVSEKQKEEWSDITVIFKNECENTDMDESNPGYKKFVENKELNFYHGGKVDWWNFAIGDREIKLHKGCGHVLKRKGFGEVLKKLSKPLGSSKIEDSKIVTVTLLHEPGAGGSTLARHVFWELHKEHRCIVVNRVTNNTVNQIMEVRRWGYENQNTRNILPVCMLIEDLDASELVDFIAELEEVSKGMHLGAGTVCVLLHCERSVMSFKINKDTDLVIPLYHKLDCKEKDWFQRKYLELENKEKELQTGEYNPDNLLAFMVMKEEFNLDYIKKVVSEILRGVKQEELLLIKYCAFLNSYRPESVIPISCCDSLMMRKLHPIRSRYIPYQKASPPWEHQVSSSFKIFVNTENGGINIHKSMAQEALKQTLEMSGNQSLLDVTKQFLESELLSSKSYSRHNLVKTTHDLLIKRTKLTNEAKTQTDFSKLIETLMNSEDGYTKAIKYSNLDSKDFKMPLSLSRLQDCI